MQTKQNIFLFIIILLLVLAFASTCSKVKERDNLISALNSELIIFKDKDNLNHSKIEVLQASQVSSFLQLQLKDSTLLELQKQVKYYQDKIKNQGSVTHFVSDTKIDTLVKTDTIYYNENNNLIYKSNFNLDKWVVGSVTSSFDNVSLNLKITNEYSVIIGEEKQSLFSFKKKKPFVEVINHNPYSQTTSLRAFKVTDNRTKKPHFGFFFGYGASYYKNNIIFAPTLGIGVSKEF